MANTRRPKSLSLRDALDAMGARTATHDLPMGPRYAETKARFRQADQYSAVALMGADENLKKSAQKARDNAKAEYESQVYRVELESLPPTEYAALRTEFPLSDDRQLWQEPLSHHLLAKCVVNGDLSAEEWAEMLGSKRFSAGDADDLCVAVANLNARPSSADVPKD
jgi:hypothetical protein